MGKIQSAITGLLASTLGLVAGKKKMAEGEAKQAAAAEDNKDKEAIKKIHNDAYGMFGEAYSTANEKQRKNLIARQDEANEIARQFVESQTNQMNAFKARVAKVNSEEAVKLRADAAEAYNATLKKNKALIENFKKRKYVKKEASK